jgi:hypothetical protein
MVQSGWRFECDPQPGWQIVNYLYTTVKGFAQAKPFLLGVNGDFFLHKGQYFFLSHSMMR